MARALPLDCRLTDVEKIERGFTLSGFVQDLKILEEEKKASGQEFKEKIDSKVFDVRSLAKIIKQGFEIRLVEVVEERDYIRCTVSIVRTDTGEIVSTRSMAVEDAQEEMAFDDDRHNGSIAYLGEG